MKSIRNKVIIFAILVGLLSVFVEILSWNPEIDGDQAFFIARILMTFMFCVLVFEVGRSLKNKMYRRKYAIYVVSFFLVTIILVLLSHTVFDDNVWLNLTATNIILFTCLCIVFDISNVIKAKGL